MSLSAGAEKLDALLLEQIDLFAKSQQLLRKLIDDAIANGIERIDWTMSVIATLAVVNAGLLELRKIAPYIAPLSAEPSSTPEPVKVNTRTRRAT